MGSYNTVPTRSRATPRAVLNDAEPTVRTEGRGKGRSTKMLMVFYDRPRHDLNIRLSFAESAEHSDADIRQGL
jgi:hypothetical protein